MRPTSLVLVLAIVLWACGDHAAAVDGAIDGPVDAASDGGDPNNPLTLFDTGLCVDRACTQISPDVHTYTPQFVLWADTASKRRWYKLPAGTQIDTTDMDHWVFPVGTKFWKEFTRNDGVNDIRVETRLIMRIGPGDLQADWFYVAYQWNSTQTDTMAVPTGVMNASGTMHDIPSRTQCRGCHENLKPSRILGFQAIQLDTAAATVGDSTLDTLVAATTLTTNPPGGASPHFPLPGITAETAGLGYVHANCGHCHNPSSAVHSIVNLELRLTVASLGATTTTPAYVTAVDAAAQVPVGGRTKIIDKTSPDTSSLIYRFEYPVGDSTHMPQLGSEMMDPTGDTTLRTWVTNIP